MFVVKESQLTRIIAPITPFYASSSDWIQLEAGELTTMGDIYRSQPAVRSVLDFMAGHLARMPLKLYQHTDAGREPLRKHPAQRLLNVPSGHRRQGRIAFWRDFWLDRLIYDRACAVKIKDLDTGDP